MSEKRQRFLIAILRFHGDVLLTTPMISEIRRIFPDSIIDLLVYKGTGSILELDDRINSVLEAEPSANSNFIKRTFKEILLLRALRNTKYDFGVFLTTQWRMALMARCLRGARTAGVDDVKRRKPFWIKSFSSISPAAGDGHIVKRNLAALETLGLTSIEEKRELSLIIPQEIKNRIEEIKKNHRLDSNYCVFHTVSRRETKLWKKESFAQLIDHYADQGLKVVLTSGPDEKEINYLKDIEKLTKTNLINLGGETRLIELAALIKDAKFFLGLDSVASHIAAAVETKGVALFGPSDPDNWRPWSNKVSVISRGKEEEFCQAHGHMEGKYKKCLCYINPERVIEELDKLVN